MTQSACDMAVLLPTLATLYDLSDEILNGAIPVAEVPSGHRFVRLCTASYRLHHGSGHDLIPNEIQLFTDFDKPPEVQVSQQLDTFASWVENSGELCHHVIDDVRTQLRDRQQRTYPHYFNQRNKQKSPLVQRV